MNIFKMMTYSTVLLLLLLLFITSQARKPDNPLHGTSSVCADVCTSPEAHLELDLSEAHLYREHERVQVTLHRTGSGRCREPALLQIPLNHLAPNGLLKFEFDFGPVLHNFSVDLGIFDQFNRTRRTLQIFNQQVSVDSFSSLETPDDLHIQSVTLLEPGEHLTIFISNDWIHLKNEQRNSQEITLNLNESNFFFEDREANLSFVSLRLGLNRDVLGQQTGIGLCSVNLTFIECLTEPESALDINVQNKSFEQADLEHIHWISQLNYLDPNADVRDCTAQGVLRLTFDPDGTRRIARLDFQMGARIEGFTFNIGDSPTNNGFGGDGGTTSNSAEIHSSENRFYIWANTKTCGDTLLLKIDYNVIEPFDNITILISNERVELTNHRSYHQILHSPYLFALARQNVTCNCFDSLCYPGVQPDNDLYVGINRVIGGTYRPGGGVCHANINWIQCKRLDVSARIPYKPLVLTTESTTTTTTTTAAPINSNDSSIDQRTETIEHTNQMIISTTVESSSMTMMTGESHLTNQNYSSSTVSSFSSSEMSFLPTTMASTPSQDEQIASTMTDFHYPTSQTHPTEEIDSTTLHITEIPSTESSTTNNPRRLFDLLANSSHLINEEISSTSSSILDEISSTASTEVLISNSTVASVDSNPCTMENLQANLIYHEYALDKHKFIFCDSEGKMNIIACSPGYVWSQVEQSCIQPN